MGFHPMLGGLGAIMDHHARQEAMLAQYEAQAGKRSVRYRAEHTPTVQRTDWKADTEAVLRSARVGAFLLAAFLLAAGWVLHGWLA
jgi:hypothetical protein